MKIIFAQGNPGSTYQNTRHNVGFLLLDRFAEAHDADWRVIDKHKARVAEISIHSEKVLLVQPQTFYNDTGLAAQSLIHFYKIDPATDFLVLHDDLALPLGTVRVRDKGRDAGNNGIKSLNTHVGEAYFRIRVGIWTTNRAIHGDTDFVLGKFTQTEMDHIQKDVAPIVYNALDSFIVGTLQSTSTTA